MSLTVSLSSSKTITTVPAQTTTLNAGDIEIFRIVDNPVEKQIKVFVNDIGEISLDSLSDSNYPSDWTNADIQSALLSYLS
jgi:hypothetical protein|tara:strand:+ start:218 stop:460 length:243 start_codon:yes stop_codon:yes gene_type:complete